MSDWRFIVLIGAATACSRAEPRESAGAGSERASPTRDSEWSCAGSFAGPAGFVRVRGGTLEIYRRASSAPTATRLEVQDLRGATVSDQVFWTSPTGVHRSGIDGLGAKLLWSTGDAFAIAAHGDRVVVSSGDGSLFVLAADGSRRQIATKLMSDSDWLVVWNDRAYVVTSLVRGPRGEGDPSVIWSVDLVGEAPPRELARATQITGFCAGRRDEVMWLELDPPAGAETLPADRVVRVRRFGEPAPLLELRALAGSGLAADEGGTMFFRIDRASSDGSMRPHYEVLELVGDGSTKVRARVPTSAVFVGVFGGHVLAETATDGIRSFDGR